MAYISSFFLYFLLFLRADGQLEACVLSAYASRNCPLIVVHQKFLARGRAHCYSWLGKGVEGGGGLSRYPAADTTEFPVECCGDCACAALFNLNYLAVNKAQWDRDRRSGMWKGLLHCKNEIFISLWIWIEAAEPRESQQQRERHKYL